MLRKLYPDIYLQSIFHIDWLELRRKGFRAIIIDLDNTVTLWNSNFIDIETGDLISNLKKLGYSICILSNNSHVRVEAVARTLGVCYVARARKPGIRSYMRCIELLNSTTNETLVIGDQIFTDILGGNRAGLYTILVKPLNKKEYFGTKLSRSLEFFILPFIKRRLK